MKELAERSRRAEEIRELTARRVQIFGDAGTDWPFAASLKSISEDTAQEYEGRALLELIQNGHDAIGKESNGRIEVLLDVSANDSVLYVANDGVPFRSTNFSAIIGFGLSDKGPGEGIGNKGLGFRSVLQLTDRPEVYSRDPEDDTDREYSGYSFRFPTEDELRGLTSDADLAQRLVAEVSPLDLPIPADVEDAEVLRFGADGFATVVRLPLRDETAVADVRRQIESVAGEPPILLFLDRVTSVSLEFRSDGETNGPVVLTRDEHPTSLLREDTRAREVDLGERGRYLVTKRSPSVSEMRDAVRTSVTARVIDRRWLDWDGEAWVGVALRLDEPLEEGTTYTFLPMEESSPLAGHVHAPFFTKLARREVSLDVPLNAFLMGEVAAACIELAGALRDQGDYDTVAPHVVDLVAWISPRHHFLLPACEKVGTTLTTESLVPLAGESGWSTLKDAYAWPQRAVAMSIISAEAVASVGPPVLDPKIGAERQGRLMALHKAVLGSSMAPSAETLAEWVESLAKDFKTKDVGYEDWARFYDDLSLLFEDSTAASALRGGRIVLDGDSTLRSAMGGSTDERRDPVLFFAPTAEDDGTDEGTARLPKDLESRIVYTHPSIPWTVAEPIRRRRPGRVFLESNGLVREYRTDRLLELLSDLMSARPSRRVQIAALQYGYSLFPTLNDSQRRTMSDVPFVVPTAVGSWLTARSSAFSGSWGTDGGELLERLIGFATEEAPGLSGLARRVLAAPADWPVTVENHSRWVQFLSAVGVNDGLPLTRVELDPDEGNRLQPRVIAGMLDLDPRVQETWVEDVGSMWGGGAHPYTRYRFASPMVDLPGALEANDVGKACQQVYAELISLGLATWPDEAFEVVVSRSERRPEQQDVHRWPTPLATYLRSQRWLPVEDDDVGEHTSFVRPADAWLSEVGQLPRFVPSVQPAVRRHSRAGIVLDRMKDLGARIWDEPSYCGAVLQTLAALIDRAAIGPQDVASFKKQCRQAWAHILEHPDKWPWAQGEPPTVIVTEGGLMRGVTLESEVTLVVPDDDDQTKQALIGLTTRPVLIVDPESGRALIELLRNHGADVVPTSDISVEVYGDDGLINADPDHPALVTGDYQWIAVVVALAAELKSGSFVRHTEQSIRQVLDRLRSIRMVRVQDVRIVVGDEEMLPPKQTKSLPIEDEAAPTVVIWPNDGTMFDWLERSADSIAYLVNQVHLAPVLQLAFTRLGQVSPVSAASIDDDMLAQALQVSEEQVRETRADLRGPIIGLLDRLRALVAYYGDDDLLATFNSKARDVSSEAEVLLVLESIQGSLPLPASELVKRCRENGDLADLRDALGLDFVVFNEALSRLDPPLAALVHPELHEQAMATFIEVHQVAILSRLREAYLELALERGDLTPYGEARAHDGLEPDPAWLDRFAVPSEEVLAERVGTWLVDHGASSDLERPTTMPEVTSLRAANFNRLDEVARAAELRLRAWCRSRGRTVPHRWGSPLSEARSVLEAAYLADFVSLASDELLELILEGLGWPADMSHTLDLTELGLDPSALLSREEADDADRRRRQHERTHLEIDGNSVPVDLESLGRLADTVASSVTEDLLNQSGEALLMPMADRSQRHSGSQGGRGLTVARNPGMSDEQKTAVGLVGEVVARAWLERHYSDVEWLSGYRNIVVGDERGSDRIGYDFTARGKSRTLYFEVKAHVGELRDFAEFELSESEVVAAQEHGESYRLLLVGAALDSSSRQVLELPSPLSRRGTGRYTILGRGLRYRCAFER